MPCFLFEKKCDAMFCMVMYFMLSPKFGVQASGVENWISQINVKGFVERLQLLILNLFVHVGKIDVKQLKCLSFFSSSFFFGG